jgi:hypothetical protein
MQISRQRHTIQRFVVGADAIDVDWATPFMTNVRYAEVQARG